MNFGDAIRTCFARYVTFSGRATRPEYWYFVLFCLLISLVAGMIDWQFFTTVTRVEADGISRTTTFSHSPVRRLTGLALFLPHLAAAWRRMQDTGRSGWYVLLPTMLGFGAFLVLIFGIGTASQFHGGTLDRLLTDATLLILIPTLIILLVSPLLVLWWLTRPSQPGSNKYGPNPQEVIQ